MTKPLTVWITTNCGKFLNRWKYQTILPASWEICIVRTGHGTTDWFQMGKGVCQGCILLPWLFNLYAEYIMWNADLDGAQAGIRIAGRDISNLKYTDDTILMAESKELKTVLMKVKEESEKVGLKLNTQKTKIMASGPIASWQIDGETMETGKDFVFWGSKITADGDWQHVCIKTWYLFFRLTSLCITISMSPQMAQFVLFYGWVILLPWLLLRPLSLCGIPTPTLLLKTPTHCLIFRQCSNKIFRLNKRILELLQSCRLPGTLSDGLGISLIQSHHILHIFILYSSDSRMVISLFPVFSTKVWALWRKHCIFVTWGLMWVTTTL